VGEGRGSTFLCGNAESPFSIHSCGITCGFKDFREHGHFFEEGEFVFVPIASGEGVTSVLARHEGVTGGSTNGVGGVVVGELETFVGKAVDVGSFEFCISEAGKVTVAEIIGKDVDDVWDGGLALQVFGRGGLAPSFAKASAGMLGVFGCGGLTSSFAKASAGMLGVFGGRFCGR